MKYLTIIFLFIFAFSTCKKEESILVVKDCTGIYLRYDSKDYLVCNYQDLASFEDGAEVKAVYTRIEECNSDQIVLCEILHKHEGLIYVDEIGYK